MERFCKGSSSDHVPNLQPMLQHKEEFCGSKYNTNSTSWTRGSNITPDNSSLYHTAILDMNPHKERFGYTSHSTYVRSGKTWNNQKPYTSN